MALAVYLVRDVLLASSGSTAEQDGDVRVGYQPYQPVHLLCPRAFPAIELASVMHGRTEHFGDGFEQLVWLEGLAQVIDRTKLHGLHSVLHLTVIGHDKERDLAMLSVHPLQQGRTVAVRQAEVCQYEVDFFG